MASLTRDVFCPLCKQKFPASSESECIAHMTSCQGFAERHGEQPRKERASKRLKALPSALDSAKTENRTREYSNDGTFTEKIPEALLDALHWWKDETQSKDIEFSSNTNNNTTIPWTQDDGTDRHYWYTLLCNKSDFISIYQSSKGTLPYLITDANQTQTAREQCLLDSLCTFSTHFCALCGLSAKLNKSRCGRCKNVHYCSTRHQQEHWKEHSLTCVKIIKEKKIESCKSKSKSNKS